MGRNENEGPTYIAKTKGMHARDSGSLIESPSFVVHLLNIQLSELKVGPLLNFLFLII